MNIPKVFFWGCALILVATTTGYSQETSSTEEAAAFVRASVPWFSPDTYALERLTTSNRGWNVSLQLKDVEDDHRLHLYFSYWQGAIEGSAVTFIRASDWRDYVEATMPITEKTRALLLRVVQAAMDRPAPSQQSDETEFAYLPKVMELLRTATLPSQGSAILWRMVTSRMVYPNVQRWGGVPGHSHCPLDGTVDSPRFSGLTKAFPPTFRVFHDRRCPHDSCQRTSDGGRNPVGGPGRIFDFERRA